jgi:hypothetical protein
MTSTPISLSPSSDLDALIGAILPLDYDACKGMSAGAWTLAYCSHRTLNWLDVFSGGGSFVMLFNTASSLRFSSKSIAHAVRYKERLHIVCEVVTLHALIPG